MQGLPPLLLLQCPLPTWAPRLLAAPRKYQLLVHSRPDKLLPSQAEQPLPNPLFIHFADLATIPSVGLPAGLQAPRAQLCWGRQSCEKNRARASYLKAWVLSCLTGSQANSPLLGLAICERGTLILESRPVQHVGVDSITVIQKDSRARSSQVSVSMEISVTILTHTTTQHLL